MSEQTENAILQWERWLLATLATVSIYGAIWANDITTAQAEQSVMLDNIDEGRTNTARDLEKFDKRQQEILKKMAEIDRQQGEQTIATKALSENVSEVKVLLKELSAEMRNR